MSRRLFVVETDDDRFLGTVQVGADSALIIKSGFVGRPRAVALDDIVRLTLAEDHEDVEL